MPSQSKKYIQAPSLEYLFYYSSVIATHSEDHCSIAFSTGASAYPFSVSSYSMMTGVEGMTVRYTISSISSSFNRSVNTRLLIFN